MKRIYTLLTALTTMFSICNAQTTEQPMPTIKQMTKGNNEISITLINHGSLAVEYKGFVIQIDPVANFGGKQFDYKKNFTKTDVILVTHEHGDHLNPQTIEQLSSADTKILLNAKSQAQLGKGEIMNNGDEVTVGEIKIKAEAPDLNLGTDSVGKPVGGLNNNERILELHSKGKSNMAIAKELGLGLGEVKLVIGLYEGM